MLNSIRKQSENFLYSLIILAVVAVMAMYGVGKLGGPASGDAAAAVVNGEVITRREFQRVLEYTTYKYQAMLGAQYDEKLLAMLQIPQRTLHELVQFKLIAQQAKSLGIIVSDEELADEIRSMPMYQRDGKFDAELYSQIPDRGLEEHRQREQIRASRFQSYLTDRIRLTPSELKRAQLLKDTKADLEYASIDFGALYPKKGPTAAEIEAFIKKTPVADLQAQYQANQKDYTEKAEVHLRRIRVAIPFKASDAVKAESKKKADAISHEVNADNFETIAKTKSDDEYAKKGGNMGWVKRGTLEKPLDDALSGLAANQISPPIETPFGYFILQVLEKKDEKTKPFDKVKETVATNMLTEKNKKAFVDDHLKSWEEILASGKSLEPELKKNNIAIKKTGSFSLGQGFIPGVGQVDSMVDAVFELSKENPVAKKLFFYQDHYYYLKLASLDLPKAEEYQKNADATDKSTVTALQGELMSDWIKSLEKTATVKYEIAFEKKGAKEEAPQED